MRTLRILLSVLLVLFFSFGCASKKKTVKSKVHEVKLYNPTSNEIHPALKMFHHKDNSSLLYISFITSEFLFNQANEKGEYMARAKLVYELIELGDKGEKEPLIDTLKMEIILDKTSNKYLATIPLNVKSGKKYFLKLFTYDLNSEKSGQSFLYIDKTSENTSQNYMILSPENSFPLFNNVLKADETFKLQNRKHRKGKLYVSFFKREEQMPNPTFSLTGSPTISLKADSVWEYEYSDTMLFYLPYQGKYFFRFDTTVNEGFTLFNFGPYFPRFMTAEEMIPPIAYINTSVDQKKLMAAKNKKLALDDFWYNLAGNMDVARELIRIYYNRAHFSNYYFTCDREGWMTDRGMIYIVYGLPDKVLKETGQEKWQYFDKQNTVTISFVFKQRENPFTDNDFELVRDASYDSHWRRAVESWRSGKVFIIE
ncbi:MAG: GWxTD domain-containing protein [Bacteroidales bacterium]|nr:GWxTD domain-containing protein [Bacteroidales bacterium]